MLEHHVHVVLGEENADRLFPGNFRGQTHQPDPLARRHAGGRFIHQQQFRLIGERDRKLFNMTTSMPHYAENTADGLLDLVGMSGFAKRACGELAYGDLKRLELAVALANQPKLLLMDEPTAGMAPRERIELMRLTAAIAKEKSIGVLFTEHDMDVVFEHADRILVLNRGSLIAEGSPDEVRKNPQVRAIYLGEGLVYDARHQEQAAP